jgi:hypothetical protein
MSRLGAFARHFIPAIVLRLLLWTLGAHAFLQQRMELQPDLRHLEGVEEGASLGSIFLVDSALQLASSSSVRCAVCLVADLAAAWFLEQLAHLRYPGVAGAAARRATASAYIFSPFTLLPCLASSPPTLVNALVLGAACAAWHRATWGGAAAIATAMWLAPSVWVLVVRWCMECVSLQGKGVPLRKKGSA